MGTFQRYTKVDKLAFARAMMITGTILQLTMPRNYCPWITSSFKFFITEISVTNIAIKIEFHKTLDSFYDSNIQLQVNNNIDTQPFSVRPSIYLVHLYFIYICRLKNFFSAVCHHNWYTYTYIHTKSYGRQMQTYTQTTYYRKMWKKRTFKAEIIT